MYYIYHQIKSLNIFQKFLKTNFPLSVSSSSLIPSFTFAPFTSAADGNGGVYLDEAQRWIDFMNEHGISWANWSLCDKNESSAALVNGANVKDRKSVV